MESSEKSKLQGKIKSGEDQISEYVQTEPNYNGFFADNEDTSCSVKVAVRIRPMVGRELREGNQKQCVKSISEFSRLQIGSKEFNFDKVFDDGNSQQDLFEVCGRNLILGCFAGYNATILAYGQSGSGKTHTMGTGSTVGLSADQVGIVPRVFDFIFEELANRQRLSEFSQFEVKVQFMELYGEDLHDLLDMGPVDKITGQTLKQLQIREEKSGAIRIDGIKCQLVTSALECLAFLNQGISQRVTSATLMNEGSSRSHAVFTITIDQKIVNSDQDPQVQPTDGGEPATSEERISAKFHFVDLAGSERIKKTGAAGKLMQEGISINKGLHALGNVISALTDEKKGGQANHVPYRDSKLTRILQDSLGGNSRTAMIACVSPSDFNYEESLSTIKYASRARNIKNKPIVNRDANSMLIEALKVQIQTLQFECKEYQNILEDKGISIPLDFQSRLQTKAQATVQQPQLPRSDSVVQQSSGVSVKEVQELKLKLARSEKAFKELQQSNSDMTVKQSNGSKDFQELQNERDELILRQEAISEHLRANSITMPKELTKEKPTSLVDEYKGKITKLSEEIAGKNNDLLAKTKKITELQTQMKRDETVLKKAIEENGKFKRDGKKAPVTTTPVVKAPAPPLLDADELKKKFMDQMTSKMEAMFEDVEPVKNDDAENIMTEVAASSLEGKDKMLAAVKQNMSQMKLEMDDLFKNSWASNISEIQKSMQAVEADRKKAPQTDSKMAQQMEKEYQKKMEELNKQLDGQLRDKARKEESIQKTMVLSEARVKALESELQKIKKERDENEAQRKYGEERFHKFKSTASKDVAAVKKTVADKEKTVTKLKSDLKKTDQLMNQKISELKSIQKRAKEEKERQKAEEEKDNETNGVDIESIKDWIKQQTEALLNQQELTGFLKKQRLALKEVEDEMLTEGDRLTELCIQKERLELERDSLIEDQSDEERLLEIELELEDVVMETDSINSTLDTLDEHQQYLLAKVNKLTEEVNSIDMDSIQPPRFRGLSSVENARATLRTFFMVLLDLNVYKRDLENKCIEQDETILELTSTITMLQLRTGITVSQSQLMMSKQKIINNVVSNLGDGVDFMDNREVGELGLSKKEEEQLTKMSLSKIVGNLRNKLKDEEKKSQVLNLKIDQLLKEKELVKQKLIQIEREKKMTSSFVAHASQKPEPKSKQKETKQRQAPVKEAGGKEVFNAYADEKPVKAEETVRTNINMGKRMSFKQRRDIVKETSHEREDREQQAMMQQNFDSLLNQNQSTTRTTTTLHERRKSRARNVTDDKDRYQLTSEQLQQLEQEVKLNLSEDQREVRRKAYQDSMLAFMIPETGEDEEYESSEQDDQEETKDDELTDELAARLEAVELLMSKQPLTKIDFQDTDDAHAWRLGDFKEIQLTQDQHLIDLDSVHNRLFLMMSNLTLIELDLLTRKVTSTVRLSEVEGAEEMGEKATAFVLQKDLNMLAVSTGHAVYLFDYESDLRYVNKIKVENVLFLTFIDVQIVMMSESEDGSEVKLTSYSDSGVEEDSITIKQFMGNQIILRPSEESIIFACGNLIGKVSVPEMKLQYQEDSGHKGGILDLVVSETCIFTTGVDQGIRVFDSENGMLLLEPMEEMECDKLALQDCNLIARCGQGAALIVFKFQDGDEELTEVDFIDLAGEDEEQKQQTVALKGGHKVSSAAGNEFSTILYAQSDAKCRLNIRMLKNRSYIT